MPKPTEKISTLRLKMPSRIDLQNVPKGLWILVVPRFLAKPGTANLVSEVQEGGQNKTRNLPRMTLNLGGGVARVRSLERAVRVEKRHLRSDLGRARGWIQGLAGEIDYLQDILL